ncbi:MAG: sulfotransferase [Chloroflexota bacterium]|nr:MAG: sulfotransferase [Chloroflexota bacterium]
MANWLFTTFYGMTLGQWFGLLRRHGYAIDPHYWPQAGFITLTSGATSIGARYENWVYGSKLRDLEIMPPLFILGHWRSGTTHLHNLLAADERFVYPNLYQVTNPQTFLSSERIFSVLGPLSPKTRLVDSMRFGFETPQEEEFAIANAALLSPYLGWAFPRDEEYYENYLTLRDVSEEEIEQWKAALVLFLKKLTWKYNRPIVLKSPAHTCRIRLLLKLFPDARFVHIHRDPYTVFQSTRRLYELMYRATRLQHSTMRGVNRRIIRRYKTMYDVFFDERDLIPDKQLHELSFHELVRHPMEEMSNVYEALSLPGFAEAQPAFQCYLDSTAGYCPHEYPELPSGLRREIAQAWGPSFMRWEYAA